MLKSKASIEKWAKEIVRCESIISSVESSILEKEQAEWKIEAIMKLYESDFETMMLLIMKIEEILL